MSEFFTFETYRAKGALSGFAPVLDALMSTVEIGQ
jgi:hypothetical protein